MDKRYTIKITEHSEENTLTLREYKQGVNITDKDPEGWGYTQQVQQITMVEREVYKQNTESLDLTEVIKAVNGLITNRV